MFTRTYRIFGIDNQAQQNNVDDAAVEQQDTNDPEKNLSWQGKNGRVARFRGVWNAVLQGWEWDQVDEAVLLNECAIPIVTELLYVLLFPILFLSC